MFTKVCKTRVRWSYYVDEPLGINILKGLNAKGIPFITPTGSTVCRAMRSKGIIAAMIVQAYATARNRNKIIGSRFRITYRPYTQT